MSLSFVLNPCSTLCHRSKVGQHHMWCPVGPFCPCTCMWVYACVWTWEWMLQTTTACVWPPKLWSSFVILCLVWDSRIAICNDWKLEQAWVELISVYSYFYYLTKLRAGECKDEVYVGVSGTNRSPCGINALCLTYAWLWFNAAEAGVSRWSFHRLIDADNNKPNSQRFCP